MIPNNLAGHAASEDRIPDNADELTLRELRKHKKVEVQKPWLQYTYFFIHHTHSWL